MIAFVIVTLLAKWLIVHSWGWAIVIGLIGAYLLDDGPAERKS